MILLYDDARIGEPPGPSRRPASDGVRPTWPRARQVAHPALHGWAPKHPPTMSRCRQHSVPVALPLPSANVDPSCVPASPCCANAVAAQRACPVLPCLDPPTCQTTTPPQTPRPAGSASSSSPSPSASPSATSWAAWPPRCWAGAGPLPSRRWQWCPLWPLRQPRSPSSCRGASRREAKVHTVTPWMGRVCVCGGSGGACMVSPLCACVCTLKGWPLPLSALSRCVQRRRRNTCPPPSPPVVYCIARARPQVQGTTTTTTSAGGRRPGPPRPCWCSSGGTSRW